MKCKKCSYEWKSYGESLTCPGCGARAMLTASEKQTLWEEAYGAEKIKDFVGRARCYHTLAEMGDEKAQYAYGECLRRGAGVARNTDEAIVWYKAAARRRYPAAAYCLARCLAENPNFVGGKDQIYFWLRVGAEFGDTNAAVELARVYETGDGVESSHRHALFWLTQAALGKHTDAATTLAKMYFEGAGVEKNVGAARYIVKNLLFGGIRAKLLAVRIGRGEAEPLPEVFIPGREEEKLSLAYEAEERGEYSIASHLYFVSARGGSMDATYRLARLYEAGEGVPKSEEEARRRYGVAAESGHLDALLRLGIVCEEGKGGDVDVDRALACYERLSAAGVADGAYRLGEIYREGKLVRTDLLAAIRHYKEALRAGHEGARVALDEIKTVADRIYEKSERLAERGNEAGADDACRAAAMMGHADAAFALAQKLAKTAKNPADRKEVFTFYRTAAEGGHVGGVYHLALCYKDGYGTARDFTAASSLLTLASKQEYENAADEFNKLRAAKYRRIARRFYSISSELYRKGNTEEAIRFRNIAAKLGSARAMYMLGCHYEFGDGVPADRTKANAWYARARNAGYVVTQGNLKGGYLRERKKLVLAKRAETK